MTEPAKKRKRFFTLEHGTTQHPKILPLSDRAFRVFVTAIDYSASNLLDGWISRRSGGVIAAVVGARSVNPYANELVTSGLWDLHENDGWVIHDYHDHQPTAAYMKKLSDAGKKAARDRWDKVNNGTDGNANRIPDRNAERNAHVLELEPKSKSTTKAVPVASSEEQRPEDLTIKQTIDRSLRGAA